jgi:hypothetical protein
VVEYGNGISHGPAGQVGGGGTAGAGTGAQHLGGQVDFFSSIGHTVHDVTSTILAQPPEVLAIGIVIFFLGLIVLRRAF